MPGVRRQLAALLLDGAAELWPSPVKARDARLGAEMATDAHHRAYTEDQYLWRVRHGLGLGNDAPALWGQTVLEIGCGHGGITCYLASIGARHVVGIDVNVQHVRYGLELAQRIGQGSGRENGRLPLSFCEMDARRLAFDDGAFDVAYADNVFEHFLEPDRVLAEIWRVLRPGGLLLIPTFSSILSKYGLHLKYGIKLPWTNLLFDEETILMALTRRAARDPRLFDAYPGLRRNPRRVRDVRAFGDLNGITHKDFLELAARCGFAIRSFRVHATRTGRILQKMVPVTERSGLLEVLSTGAAAILEKPAVAA